MKKILILMVTFFFVFGIASSVPVWKKHADLDIKSSERDMLEELLIYSKTEWLYKYRDSTQKSHIYYTNDSGNTYTDLTKSFETNFGLSFDRIRIQITKSKQLVVLKAESSGNSIWISDDIGKTWFVDSTIQQRVHISKILFKKNSIYAYHPPTFDSTQKIFKYTLSNNKIEKSLFYLPKDELNQLIDNKFDVNDDDELFIAPNIVSMIYTYYYPRIYDSDGELISELDFNADYFPYEYNPQKK